jgi:hypothetical protein
MRRGAELFHQGIVTLHSDGGLFRISVQNLFEKVCDRFAARGVEILTPANPGEEYLLGDVPAITIASAAGQYGLSQGVTVDEADMIFMPLTRAYSSRSDRLAQRARSATRTSTPSTRCRSTRRETMCSTALAPPSRQASLRGEPKAAWPSLGRDFTRMSESSLICGTQRLVSRYEAGACGKHLRSRLVREVLRATTSRDLGIRI